jgi:hypothetical protein
MQPLLTQDEAAELLELSVRTIERLRVSGRGPKFLKAGNSDGKGGYSLLRMPLGTWWLSHRDRRQHRGVTFCPGALEVVSECLNMWQGVGRRGRNPAIGD